MYNFAMSPKSEVPAGVFWTSLFLLVMGSLALVGSLLPARDSKAIVTATGSLLLIGTAILVLRNHKWALSFAVASASLLTIGVACDTLYGIQFSWRGIGRFVLLATLYWTACLWYRKWRPSSAPNSIRPN
jgi:hypothetical protein